jgi:hypothetical protein
MPPFKRPERESLTATQQHARRRDTMLYPLLSSSKLKRAGSIAKNAAGQSPAHTRPPPFISTRRHPAVTFLSPRQTPDSPARAGGRGLHRRPAAGLRSGDVRAASLIHVAPLKGRKWPPGNLRNRRGPSSAEMKILMLIVVQHDFLWWIDVRCM